MGLTKVERLAIDLLIAEPFSRDEPRRVLEAALEAKSPGSIARARERARRERADRIFSGRVPEWAKRLVRKHGAGRVSSFTVRHSKTKPYSTGRCWYGSGEIVVTLGTNRTHLKVLDGKLVPKTLEELDAQTAENDLEHRAVVLHEIAHALSPGAHDDRFYAEWRRLLAAEGILRAAVASGRFGKLRARKLTRRQAALRRP